MLMLQRSPANRKENVMRPQKKTGKPRRVFNRLKKSNNHLRTMSLTLLACCTAASCNILYTMISHKHIWSQHNVLDPAIANSVVTSGIHGTRGTIYDRNQTVLATDTDAWTAIVQFDRTGGSRETASEDDSTEETNKETEKEETEAKDTEKESSEKESSEKDSDSTDSSEKEDSEKESDDSEKDSTDETDSKDEDQKEDRTDSTQDSKKEASLYCSDAAKTAKEIKAVLKDAVDEETLKNIIQSAMDKGLAQTELGAGTKRLDEKTMEELKARQIDGLQFLNASTRTYPQTPFASSLIGFAAYNEDQQNFTGNGGLEAAMESYLSGKDGLRRYQQTRAGDVIPGTDTVIEQPVNGYDVTLTLDATLQNTVEEQMQKTMDDNNASKAWCLVMEVETGRILAWASYPTYNQNTREDLEDFTDNIAQMTFEPGSVMKPFVYAAAIDSGVYPYNGTYRAGEFVYTENGDGQIVRLTEGDLSGYPVIRDALGTDYGTLTFSEGLAHSSNIAICELLANYLNRSTFNKYLDAFGYFKPTGIDFMPESNGVRNTGSASGYLSTGFGQASSITPLQLCQAYTAIFNDGVMMKPYVVSSISEHSTGREIIRNEPEAVGTPVSANTARQVTDIMTTVLDEGMSGERFYMDGVELAAKTGTGEVYDPNTGTYSATDFTSSIVAAAPASDPKIMVYWGMISANYLNYSESYFQTIMRAALLAANVNGGTSQSEESDYESWQSWTMPSLTNHSLEFAQSSLEGKEVNTVVLGDGTEIIDQYPRSGSTISTGDNVLLLTNDSTITMPNVIGWTRKDLIAFWQLTGIPISFEGNGQVSWQSIDPDTVLQKDTEIQVTMTTIGGT